MPIALWVPARFCNHCASSSLPHAYSRLFHSASCRALSVPAGYRLATRQVPTYRTPDFAQAENICYTRSQCMRWRSSRYRRLQQQFMTAMMCSMGSGTVFLLERHKAHPLGDDRG